VTGLIGGAGSTGISPMRTEADRRLRPVADPIAPVAVAGGRLLTGLVDVTDDVSALDSAGTWAVVVPFDGRPVCAHFAQVDRIGAAARIAADRGWPGVSIDRWSSSLDRDAFEKGVDVIREAIAAGDVYQVNLCRVLSAPVAGPSDIVPLFDALSAAHPAPHAALVSLPDHGVHVASASPERFLRRDGGRVESRPIKGTAADRRDLAGSAKDRAENVMIVDLVRNDLGRVCEWGSVTVDALCRIETHPGLVHLVSTVSGRLRPGVGWADVFEATFPPGSVTGAPKLAALDHIAQLEPVSRGVYCGAVGFVDADAGVGDLNVAIRTFWIDGDRLRFGTGAGITWDSDPVAEWEETELKASRLLAVAASR